MTRFEANDRNDIFDPFFDLMPFDRMKIIGIYYQIVKNGIQPFFQPNAFRPNNRARLLF